MWYFLSPAETAQELTVRLTVMLLYLTLENHDSVIEMVVLQGSRGAVELS